MAITITATVIHKINTIVTISDDSIIACAFSLSSLFSQPDVWIRGDPNTN